MSATFQKTLPLFPGMTTFKNLPFQAPLDQVDYAIFGIPFDTASTHFPEARFGPNAIRNRCSFSGGIGYNANLDIQVDDILCGTDLGELFVQFGYTDFAFEQMALQLQPIVSSAVIPIVMGGGQIVTLAELRALAKLHGPLAMIHFDSKRDVSTDGELYDDGNVIRHAVEEGLIQPAKSIQLGMRGGYPNKAYAEFGKDLGMQVLTAATMHDLSIPEIVHTILQTVGDTPCFISLDMSFLDPFCAPATGAPISGGFTTYDIRTILRSVISEVTLKGFDLVELAPVFDVSDITAQASDGILTDVISAMAKHKAKGGC